ncbi:uncharacterized protein LOC120689183 [Panicum virgatum]|uniref:uncharacterized protein LOC120689183 n=1 Tax=Panicum virgatum TaxID=38727 RepID=UPI0019D624D9|nr:uncharacterized protein LOC120689183 [Panicum virgatum]
MLTYRKKGVIRVKVGMLDKSQLPHTTVLVFGTQGYPVTFTQEAELFLPATIPPSDDDPMDHDDLGDADHRAEKRERDAPAKKLRSTGQSESSFPHTSNGGSGQAPMQHSFVVTPLGNRRPCPPIKPIVLDGTKKPPLIAVTPPKGGFRPHTTNALSNQQVLEGGALDEVTSTSSKDCDSTPGLDSEEAGAEGRPAAVGEKPLCPSLSLPPVTLQTCTTRLGEASTPLREDRQHSPLMREEQQRSPLADSAGAALLASHSDGVRKYQGKFTTNMVPAQSGNSGSGQLENTSSAGFSTPNIYDAADELVMDKAMRRAASRNLDSPLASCIPTDTPFASHQAQNMKNILCAFEQLSGLKVNFHKSEIFCFGQEKNFENQYMELFGV